LGRLRDQLKRALFGRITGASKDQGWISKQLGAALNWIPVLRELGDLGTMCLGQARKGKLLDIGCGNGRFLAMMREAGWEVTGIEPDPAAAAIARKRYGIAVIEGPLKEAALPPASYDAITLNHVIEHVPDPVALLVECRRLLKVGGTMVVTTPNIESLGHRLLSDAWVHLDPPRHLFLFSLNTLGSCCEKAGFCIEVQRTTFRNAAWTWLVGKAIRREGRYNGNSNMFTRIGGLLFLGREISALRKSPYVGEELLVVATPGVIEIPVGGQPHSIASANAMGGA
jgi:2-polyprenyl-3-methyl-5-hydroxy-6-metoxy-1,4-benzoquinol methylase